MSFPIGDATLLDRLRGEYLEMPGLRLTLVQARRLWGIDAQSCRAMLDRLVAERFLCVKADGSYARPSDGAASWLSPRANGHVDGPDIGRSGDGTRVVASGPPLFDDEEWKLTLSPLRPTTLVEGPHANLLVLLCDVAGRFVPPVTIWDGLGLPHEGTVIVENVDQLSDSQQRRLSALLSTRARRVQVIAMSTASHPVYALVQHRALFEELYYQLSIVRIDATIMCGRLQ